MKPPPGHGAEKRCRNGRLMRKREEPKGGRGNKKRNQGISMYRAGKPYEDEEGDGCIQERQSLCPCKE